MSDKCEKCGGELVEGTLSPNVSCYFYPLTDLKKFTMTHNKIPVTCKCCKKCGLIQDFRVKELSRLH